MEIIVEDMDIGIGMMQPIMLVTPQPLAPAEYIEHAAHEPVRSFVAGVAPVCPIMGMPFLKFASTFTIAPP